MYAVPFICDLKAKNENEYFHMISGFYSHFLHLGGKNAFIVFCVSHFLQDSSVNLKWKHAGRNGQNCYELKAKSVSVNGAG